MKKWVLRQPEREINAFDADTARFGSLCAHIMTVRGVPDGENGDGFMNPFLMKDMDKAVGLIKSVLAEGGKITVYGDYDCDGITSTVMLHNYLSAIGGEVDWYIPSREEGYGLNEAAVEKIAEAGAALVITVDNGVSAVREAELLKEKGVQLIITDHHTPPECLPFAAAVIDPKQRDDEYPFKDLAGCGVVLKLISALEDETGTGVIEQYGDLAAIGTIGDIVPITGENRYIVQMGLEGIKYSENIGLYRLLKSAGLLEREIDAVTVAYMICPRINAAGRFAHPSKAAELLLCENEELAAVKAEELISLNNRRVEEEKKVTELADGLIASNPRLLNERVLILIGENWHHGVIGIVSAKMVTRYGKPCVIISRGGEGGEIAKGSCRGTEGFSVIEMLRYCGGLLIKHGGHANAGGFSIENNNIAAFTERLLRFAKEKYEVMPAAVITADKEITLPEMTLENAEKLEFLQPFGAGNPEPVFLMKNCLMKRKRPLKDGKYVSFEADFCGGEVRIVDFKHTYGDFWYGAGDNVDLLVTLGVNEYNGVCSVSVKLIDIRLAGLNQDKFFAAADAYERLQRREEIDKKLKERIIPDDAQMRKLYGLIRRFAKPDSKCFFEEIAERGQLAGINYCMLRIITDVFEETGLIKINIPAGYAELIETKNKTDLTQSRILKELNGLM